jgi:hypothetical protein
MKDLFVLTADADMQAVFRSVLARPDALGIRAIDFDVDRYYRRDSGVYTEGPEFLRDERKSRDFHRFILALDHHGSGCHKRPADCAGILQTRLDSCSFTNRSAVIVIEPELEEWLVQDPAAIGGSRGVVNAADPKSELHNLFLQKYQRKPRPPEYGQIALRADLGSGPQAPASAS